MSPKMKGYKTSDWNDIWLTPYDWSVDGPYGDGSMKLGLTCCLTPTPTHPPTHTCTHAHTYFLSRSFPSNKPF